jgi:protocatechuate 3,4-dioxygenase beta subunit
MRFLASFIAFLLAFVVNAQAAAQSKPPLEKRNECSVAGMIIKLAGSEPLRGSNVQLSSTDDRALSTSIVTDVAGRFTLKGIAPGHYRLRVSKNGFVDQQYGERKPGDPGSILTLRPGQDLKDLLFRMLPSAVISGRILDEDGDPLPFVEVSALRQVYSDGKRKLASEAQFQTNDLGEYRLFGLPPGKYFVSAVYHGRNYGLLQSGASQKEADVEEMGYSRLYYPGTPDPARASPIAVKVGEEIPSVEFLMRRFPVFRIRGRVYDLTARRLGRNVNLMLVPKTTALEWERADQQVRVDAQDGTFEIRDVLPGSYSLMAFLFDEGRAYSTRTSIEVSNSDLLGVAVTLSTGVTVSGRIVWDGPAALMESELHVIPSAVDRGIDEFTRNARVDAANLFTLQNVAEGTYRARVWGQSRDCYIKDVRYGSASALEEGFTVSRSSPAPLEITLSSRGARVQGSVLDADHLPAAGVRVVLVPDPRHRSRNDLFKSQTTDQYGHFDIRGIAPGEYKVFSWEEVEDGAWEDPEFLRLFEEKGESVETGESDQKTLNLTAIRAGTADRKP